LIQVIAVYRVGMFGLYVIIFFLSMAILAPWISTHDDPNSPTWARTNPVYAQPSLDYLFGTDYNGKDVYSLTVWGARASLLVGILASLILSHTVSVWGQQKGLQVRTVSFESGFNRPPRFSLAYHGTRYCCQLEGAGDLSWTAN